MGVIDTVKKQFRSVIQWDYPQPWQLFYKFTAQGDELKNASKLILQEGQGCIFTHEGKIVAVFQEAGIYDLKTSNKPFITTLKKILYAFESEHKVGLWFFKASEMVNIRWGTRIPIKYNDPVYGFPVHLRAYGNYSLKITQAQAFFSNILAGQLDYFTADLQELFLSRITQPISNYLANAKFSYAEIDSNIELIASDAQEKTVQIFNDLGFKLNDFRIEGTSFDDETNKRISEISNVQAEAKAATIAGISFTELQQLKAMRDAANNQGTAGATTGILTGMQMNQQAQQPATSDIKTKLKELKILFEEDLIDEEEYKIKKNNLISKL